MRKFILFTMALLLAGCSDEPEATPSQSPSPGTPQAPPVEVEKGSRFGAISGYVVDDAIQLLAGAQVRFADGTRNVTAEDGTFVFRDLEPGAYLLMAELPGYASVTTNVEVQAGSVTQASMMLARVAGTAAYHYTVHHEGFIQASPAFGGAIADAAFDGFLGSNPLCSNCIFTLDLQGEDGKTLVVEAFWDNTLPPVTGEDLFLAIINENFTLDKPGYGAAMTSPFLYHLNVTDPLFNEGEHSNWWRFQVSGSLTQPTYNQKYDLYVTVFLNEPAPPEWSLVGTL